jgi:hypothetical protein
MSDDAISEQNHELETNTLISCAYCLLLFSLVVFWLIDPSGCSSVDIPANNTMDFYEKIWDCV